MVPSVLASSICWSLQCLISTLTQRGQWWTPFLASLVQSRCGEGGMLQTNNTGVCSQPRWACPRSRRTQLRSRLLRWEPSEAGLGLHAPPRSKPRRLRHSGSPQRCSLGWACVLCPSRQSSSGVRRARSLRLIASPVPAAQFSGCTAGAPSQADGDCPEPQKVLVSKEACLQFGG